ncbi:MAG: hypothetical protein FJZ87_13665 [Chloroflexi bacterium]|nr:hypothetical protein [Chloroflexota bacterium]
MNRRRAVLILAVFLLSSLLAYFIRDGIYEWVILPLAYIWWVIGLYYRMIPQMLLWLGLIFISLIIAVRSLVDRGSAAPETNASPRIPMGPIESLSNLIQKRERGTYYQWLIANRLGLLANDWMNHNEGMPAGSRVGYLANRGWNLPQEVLKYLETGLNGSFADYPRPVWWSRRRPTPLDASPREVIERLHSEMEIKYHGRQ